MMPIDRRELVAGAGDQLRVDELRVRDGMLGYCPVCRRSHSTRPAGAIEAMRTIVEHLATDHDPYFLAQLAIALDAVRRPQPVETVPIDDPAGQDPYYPDGVNW